MLRIGIVIASCLFAASCSWFQGQQHSGPAPRTALPAEGRAAFYVVVERGQTLDRIAHMYHSAKRDIMAANKLRMAELKPGMLLEVPLNTNRKRRSVVVSRRPKPAVAARARPKRIRTATAKRARYSKAKHVEVIPLD